MKEFITGWLFGFAAAFAFIIGLLLGFALIGAVAWGFDDYSNDPGGLTNPGTSFDRYLREYDLDQSTQRHLNEEKGWNDALKNPC